MKKDGADYIRITRGDSPCQREVLGKANELVTAAALLDRSRSLTGERNLEYSLAEIVERLLIRNGAPMKIERSDHARRPVENL